MDKNPNITSNDSDSLHDWIEQHDKLPVDEHSSFYQERNQKDWWEQNKRIRRLFADTESEMKVLVKAGKAPSVRMVSWSQLANKIGCHRATLKHERRLYWTNEQRNRLLLLIDSAKQQKDVALDKSKAELSEVEQLQSRLQNQRDQTAIWYDKCVGLEEQVDTLKSILAKREEKIRDITIRNHQS